MFIAKNLHFLRHKLIQTTRLSRKSLDFLCLLIGSVIVSLTSLGFAKLADLGLELNIWWVKRYPYLAWIILPLGLAFLTWATKRFAPNVAGSGIPQVIASIKLPYTPFKTHLIKLETSLLKIPLTFLAMLIGASVGREGPSVQVGAAVMLAWGNFCRKHNLAFKGMCFNQLIATGAAGGLAAAFNAPLAGVIFAIEELGRGVILRWERRVLFGVLASGFIFVAIMGNNPYFSNYRGINSAPNMLMWVLLCAVINGILGGITARMIAKGPAGYVPPFLRGWVRRNPVVLAVLLGIILAALGVYSDGTTYGTGYSVVMSMLNDSPTDITADGIGILKILATIFTYWTGIAGGIFSPALTMGAGIGSDIWALTGGIVDERLLVLLSMSAFLAALTQSPLTAAVVVMEMTGSQSTMIWGIMGSLIASVVSRHFCPKPFYHLAAGRYRQQMQELNNS
ncbi:chloride channel protein [Phocoenobacter skyensis]|uniref:Chloride channel protein n=1 Tax=Phocoenobacter skyensis TaxID=97481 RepID=A0A1H7UBU8_9PAST|nr:chloride channel protein [Pasteurella skyensis]MDP8080265.1 chloride channel protein [Pasteurella skyensis]MDP8086255.1 chloride channel protein [Pasteurella skyensis]MDP8184616.1 chloride channel protein [Pasteurella skyensis]QLB23566.1 chloride channel protein EriC [Pasteurella skyensis]SEL94530.1 H+/Cl-antiporter ClcA [Pasteurella skyensis]